jgi:hypothetical protein
MDCTAFVYEWKNSIGKRYIGYHLGKTDDGYISSSKSIDFWNDWNDVSIKWERDIIAVGSKEEMLDLERQLLKEHKNEIYNGTSFYNNSIGGGVVFTNEVRKKISQKNKGKVSPYKGKTSPKICCMLCHAEVSRYQLDKHYDSKSCKRKRNGPKTRKMDYSSVEWRKKISDALKGKKKSKETRKRMSDANRNRSTISRKKMSEETKEKLRTCNLGNNNPSYGTVWITNGKVNKRIKKIDIVPEGWYNGRTL